MLNMSALIRAGRAPSADRPEGAGAASTTLACRPTAEDAREALDIAIAIRESQRLGNVPVQLPVEDRSLRIISGDLVRSNSIPLVVLMSRKRSSISHR